MRGNVPLNNALMRVTQVDALGEATWRSYVSDWTRWNHVRTVACFAAMALYIVALVFFIYESVPMRCFDMLCLPSPDAETS